MIATTFKTGESQNSQTMKKKTPVVPENCQPVANTFESGQAKPSEAVTTDHSQSGTPKKDPFRYIPLQPEWDGWGNTRGGSAAVLSPMGSRRPTPIDHTGGVLR